MAIIATARKMSIITMRQFVNIFLSVSFMVRVRCVFLSRDSFRSLSLFSLEIVPEYAHVLDPREDEIGSEPHHQNKHDLPDDVALRHEKAEGHGEDGNRCLRRSGLYRACDAIIHRSLLSLEHANRRSEERRVGEEGRSRWSPHH